jgi:hypothetical protein
MYLAMKYMKDAASGYSVVRLIKTKEAQEVVGHII